MYSSAYMERSSRMFLKKGESEMSKTKIIINIVPGFIGLTFMCIASALGAYCGAKHYEKNMKEGKKHE